jgi:hypothetical protein
VILPDVVVVLVVVVVVLGILELQNKKSNIKHFELLVM